MRSKATALVNLEAGYKFSRRARVAVEALNLLDSKASDIHLHPTIPRTLRVSFIVGR